VAVEVPVGRVAACSLDECLAAIDRHGFDPEEPESVAMAGHWLARLAANRSFLGDIAIAQLKAAYQSRRSDGYTPQVVMLDTPRPGWFMRANIWPSGEESVMRESGEAAFVYGLPHDHNFHFLTIGYHGPGYMSDHYEVDPVGMTGFPGEQVALRPRGRSILSQGSVRHYRAQRDVHCQHPPASLSVSINLMHSAPDLGWIDQYAYDLPGGTISRVLTASTADTLTRLALALDPGEGRDLVESMATSHALDRLRWSAIDALAMSQTDADARLGVYATHAADGQSWLARRCRAAIGD
jgi:hypothetical protein